MSVRLLVAFGIVLLFSRVASSRPFFGRLGLPPMMFDPQLGEPIEFV